MKKYDAPRVYMVSCNEQDIVCESCGMAVGNGGSDIANWRWQLPSAAAYSAGTVIGKGSNDL